jgi:thiosulfate dehydrogenase
MKRISIGVRGVIAALLLAWSGLSAADPHARAKPEDFVLKSDLALSTGQVLPAGTRWYRPPDIARLRRELGDGQYKGDIEQGKRILFGYKLLYSTYYTVGDGRKDGKPSLAKGRVMSCANCHAQGGTVPYAWPFFRTLTFYGLRESGDEGVYFGGLAYHRDARTRARDCGLECGGEVDIPEASYEMDALIAWMGAVRDGIYPGEGLLIPEFKTKDDVDKIPGARVPLFRDILDMKADPEKGKALFSNRCSACHGKDGKGHWGGEEGYRFPPLSGDGSFSHAGGPLMVPVGAAFLHRNMPLSEPGVLSEQQALDVMGYIATLPRRSVWWQDYYFRHDPCSRPPYLTLQVGAVPKGFPFSKEQVQFGPWRKIAEWLASDTCKSSNPPSTPVLNKDFDAAQPR